MSIDSKTIDRIVANVLQQLGTKNDAAPDVRSSSTATATTVPQRSGSVTIDERVITADLLSERVNGATVVGIGPKAVLTPSARDFIQERGLRVDRGTKGTPPAAAIASLPVSVTSAASLPELVGQHSLLVVVRNTDAVAKLWADMQSGWTRELLGCPDDAASLAIREISRGALQTVVILAEQAHRAACLANRSTAVKAAAVQDAGEIALVRRQLRANVWCLDPTPKNWFELRNVFNALTKPK